MMIKKPFESGRVITQHISESNFCTYFVGFDINNEGNSIYRWKDLINTLQKAILEFAFGYHEEVSTLNMTEKLSEAAKSIYNIKEVKEACDLYDEGGCIEDDDQTKDYLRRGEFGELILHVLLRDFHNTIPLISKIYFKDSYGATVHGFDAVHIQPETKTLWLGESKIYTDGKKGIPALIQDIKNHIKRDYLQDEFAIISKRIKPYTNIPGKDHWLNLLNSKTRLSEQLKAITIPLLCTYSSKNFEDFSEESKEFFEAYEKEVRELKNLFDIKNDHPLKTKLNIILFLFPVKCKKELVKRLHKKLSRLQDIENDE